MIAQQEKQPREQGRVYKSKGETACIRDGIVGYLGEHHVATAQTLAAQFGLTSDQLRGHLAKLRAQGRVRSIDCGPSSAGGQRCLLWELFSDDEGPTDDERPVRWAGAARFDNAWRDPLVAALFGPAQHHIACGA